MQKEVLNQILKQVLDAAYHVNNEMGPGLLESVYEVCLLHEFTSRHIDASSKVYLPLFYKGTELNKDFRIDMLVENELIIEDKSVDILLPVHEAQIISYPKLSNKGLGFLINFNVPLIKNGFRRFVNNLY